MLRTFLALHWYKLESRAAIILYASYNGFIKKVKLINIMKMTKITHGTTFPAYNNIV
jgi:hypothetical protein